MSSCFDRDPCRQPNFGPADNVNIPLPISRRQLLSQGTAGIGLLGLAEVFGNESPGPLEDRAPHFAPRAKRIIHLLMNGGPSHIATFDPTPVSYTHLRAHET